jgi:roadblock/LC7 domain-containing protein
LGNFGKKGKLLEYFPNKEKKMKKMKKKMEKKKGGDHLY